MSRLLCLVFLIVAFTTLSSSLPLRTRLAARHVPTAIKGKLSQSTVLAPTPIPSSSFIQTLESSDSVGTALKSQIDASWNNLPAARSSMSHDDEELASFDSSSPSSMSLLEMTEGAKHHASRHALVMPDYRSWLPSSLKTLLADVDSTHEVSQEKINDVMQDNTFAPSMDSDAPLEFLELGTSADVNRATTESTTSATNGMQVSASLKALQQVLQQARAEAAAASAARVAHYEKFFAALHAAASDAADAKADAGDSSDRDAAMREASDLDAADRRRYGGGSGDEMEKDGSPDFLQHSRRPPWGTGDEDEWRRNHSYNDKQLTEQAMKSRGPLDVWVVGPEQVDKTINTPHNDVGPVRPPTPPGEKPGQSRSIPGLKLPHTIPEPQYPENHGSRSPASMYENSLQNPELATAKRLATLKPVAVTQVLPLRATLVDEVETKTETKGEADEELLRLQREYGM